MMPCNDLEAALAANATEEDLFDHFTNSYPE